MLFPWIWVGFEGEPLAAHTASGRASEDSTNAFLRNLIQPQGLIRIDEGQTRIMQHATPLNFQPALPKRRPQSVEQQADHQPTQHDLIDRMP